MKRLALLSCLCLIFLTLPLLAERGNDADRKSKNGKTEGKIDGVAISIEYGRPEVRGREIFGELVPFGKVWRTGANEATTISFGADVLVEGKALAAGTYGLFTQPGDKEWQVIFNRNAEQWGSSKYSDKDDALRVSVKPAKHEPTEVMTIAIEGDHVALRWEKLEVSFAVAAP